MTDNAGNLYLISGSDESGIENAAGKLLQKLVGENPDPFLCDTIVESDNLSPLAALQQAISSVKSPPFMGGRKTVWLKNFSGFPKESKTGAFGGTFSLLYDFIENGVPPDICFVLSGPGIDHKKKLYKLCREKGTVKEYEKPVPGSREWQQQMASIIKGRARDKKVEIESEAVEYLVETLGADTNRIDPELEKLISYCGGTDQPITLSAARELCRGEGEIVAWAIRDAMGQRNPAKVLELTQAALQSERDPDRAIRGMIRQTADNLYAMIQILLLMRQKKTRTPRDLANVLRKMEAQEKKKAAENGIEIIHWHPYRVQMLAEQAVRFSGPELITAVKDLRDAFWESIYSPSAGRTIWENTVLKIIG